MGLKILIVDDDPNVVELLSFAATARGHTPIAATDGERALKLASASAPDVITLDIMMPGLDGRDVLARLKQNRATQATPVIVLSAVDDYYVRRLCQEYGAVDYILKPVNLDRFFALVERAAVPAPRPSAS